ncbi:MAG: hypothetical protein ABI550_04230 [Ignavibacteriaceae bacterium]
MYFTEKIYKKKETNINTTAVYRLTAFWGFTEAFLGGILHALKIPLTGLLVGGAAVLFITLIAHFSDEKGAILKSTFAVILIKGFVSPYTPFPAYFAVLLQGILGEVLFSSKKFFKFSALMLGFSSLLFSGAQKIIIITILFGNSFWESINIFSNYILNQFVTNSSQRLQINFSLLVIVLYLGLHLIAGILIGIFAGNLPQKIKNINAINFYDSIKNDKSKNIFLFKKAQKKYEPWWKKLSWVLLFLFFTTVIILSFFYPELNENLLLKILIMIIRSIFLMIVWIKIISPVLVNFLRKSLNKKLRNSTLEIGKMLNFFPKFKKMINYSWSKTSELKGLKRIKIFIEYSIAASLTVEVEHEDE